MFTRTTRVGASPGGRRIALERKWRSNVAHYGGRTKLLTLTPPGEDLLPFGDSLRRGHRLVEQPYREVWNLTAQARASRLFEAAQRAADRWVKRNGWSGLLPRQVGNVRAEQKRGVWHFHWQLPFETPVEQLWSRAVHKYLDQAWRQDQRRWPDERERRQLLWREYAGDGGTKGFYGFGFVNGGHPAGRSSSNGAAYMARNAAVYMAGNVAGRGRHYVSSRLTSETGVTMRTLRACNWLWVRRREAIEPWVPGHWSDEWRDEVLRTYAAVSARAP